MQGRGETSLREEPPTMGPEPEDFVKNGGTRRERETTVYKMNRTEGHTGWRE